MTASSSQTPTPDLRSAFGFGVAGNFAGHLEQAGEAADFVGIGEATPQAPKGIFPWFVPGRSISGGGGQVEEALSAVVAAAGSFEPDDRGVPAFLGEFPISSHELAYPAEADGPVNLQIEPEVGLLAHVSYDAAGAPAALSPVAIGAFNDCSIRRPGAKKISHKKNWGARTKGLSATLLPVDDLSPDGPTATYRLACFLGRGGETLAYGVDSPLPEYSYYGAQLLDWILDRLANQHGAAETPLEPVGAYLRAAGNPETVVVGIGATRYTPLGESTFLEPGDESIVVIYDGALHTPDQVAKAIAAGAGSATDADAEEATLEGASILRQRVVEG